MSPGGISAGSLSICTSWPLGMTKASSNVRNAEGASRGEPTRLRVNAEHNCWVVVGVDMPSFRPRRHHVAMGGKAMALLDAALVLEAEDATPGRIALER